jgi:hypothetical protein
MTDLLARSSVCMVDNRLTALAIMGCLNTNHVILNLELASESMAHLRQCSLRTTSWNPFRNPSLR